MGRITLPGVLGQWMLLAMLGGYFGAPLCMAIESRTIRGDAHYDLKDVAGALGMESRWTESEETLRLESQWTRMSFTRGSRSFELNGITVYLGHPIAFLGGTLWIPKLDYERTLQPILTPQVFSDPPKLYRIVIDAGHGGRDPGAMNESLKLFEKYLTLDLAERLGAILRDRGYEIIFTRSDDTFLELKERSTLANQVGADLFISLHFNAAGSSSVSGAETYVYTPRNQPSTARSRMVAADRRFNPANKNDVWNLLAAFHVQRELVTDLGTEDRGVKRARFAVLQHLECPGLLVEGGFLTHSREGRNIGSAAYRQKMAIAIAEGILTYQKTLNRIRAD